MSVKQFEGKAKKSMVALDEMVVATERHGWIWEIKVNTGHEKGWCQVEQWNYSIRYCNKGQA